MRFIIGLLGSKLVAETTRISQPIDDDAAQEIASVVIKDAERGIAALNSEPFSPKAFAALQKVISWFIGEVIEQSIKVSKRHRADTVAESHVQLAAEYLVGDAPVRILRHLGTLGGIMLGAGLSNLLSMIAAKNITGLSVILTVALSVIGSFLVALHIARD